MSGFCLVDYVVNFLIANKEHRFTPSEIACNLLSDHPNAYKGHEIFCDRDGETLLDKITKDIDRHCRSYKSHEKNISWSGYDVSTRRLFVIHDLPTLPRYRKNKPIISDHLKELVWDGKERSLYPIVSKSLSHGFGIYSTCIDDRKSSNVDGSGANTWFHPDIVAFKPIGDSWGEDVKSLVKSNKNHVMDTWSFEIKKSVNMANVTKYFYQTLSNSGWANLSYLVVTSIVGEKTKRQLRELNENHGVGVIVINMSDNKKASVFIKAKRRKEMDWPRINKLSEENSDFSLFVQGMKGYVDRGELPQN